MVYLTHAYAAFFAMQACEDGDDKALILEIAGEELCPDYFYPDEDFIAQALSHQRGEPLESVHEEVREELEGYRHHWADSLQAMGNVAYCGAIPVGAITRYVVFDPAKQKQVAWTACDPSITPLNYKLCGYKYRSLTAWLFGDREDYGMGYTTNDEWFKLMKDISPEMEAEVRAAWQCRDGIEVITLRGAK